MVDVKEYERMEASELRVRLAVSDAENRVLRTQLDRAVNERNRFIEKATGVSLPDSNIRRRDESDVVKPVVQAQEK